MLTDIALLACLTSTLFMTGLIWFVQVVHYPLFGRVGSDSFVDFHAGHTRLTTVVVLGPMLVELATSAWLAVSRPEEVGATSAWLGLGAAMVSWASTGLVQVPCHDRLAQGFRHDVHRRLVRSNWARVAAWTTHAAIVLVMVASRIGVSGVRR